MNNLPGFGDEATWGAIVSRSDPRHCPEPYEFDTEIGDGDATVTVKCRVWGNEIDEIEEVIYKGLNILPTMEYSTELKIMRKYKDHARARDVFDSFFEEAR